MIPESDKTSKDFFQQRWHQPLYRLGKVILPILLSSLTIFLGFLGISQLVLCAEHHKSITFDDQMQLVLYSFICVVMGVVLAVGRYLYEQRLQSRFIPIQIHQNPPKEKKGTADE